MNFKYKKIKLFSLSFIPLAFLPLVACANENKTVDNNIFADEIIIRKSEDIGFRVDVDTFSLYFRSPQVGQKIRVWEMKDLNLDIFKTFEVTSSLDNNGLIVEIANGVRTERADATISPATNDDFVVSSNYAEYQYVAKTDIVKDNYLLDAVNSMPNFNFQKLISSLKIINYGLNEYVINNDSKFTTLKIGELIPDTSLESLDTTITLKAADLNQIAALGSLGIAQSITRIWDRKMFDEVKKFLDTNLAQYNIQVDEKTNIFYKRVGPTWDADDVIRFKFKPLDGYALNSPDLAKYIDLKVEV